LAQLQIEDMQTYKKIKVLHGINDMASIIYHDSGMKEDGGVLVIESHDLNIRISPDGHVEIAISGKDAGREATAEDELNREKLRIMIEDYLSVLKDYGDNKLLISVAGETGSDIVTIKRVARPSGEDLLLQTLKIPITRINEFSYNSLGGEKGFFIFLLDNDVAVYLDKKNLQCLGMENKNPGVRYGMFRFVQNPLRQIIIKKVAKGPKEPEPPKLKLQ